MSTGTGRKPDVPRSQVQMTWFDGEIIKHFWVDFPERKERFSSWELELKNFAVDWILAEKMLPAYRRLLFPLLHAEKGNRRRLHAGKKNAVFVVTGPGPCHIKMNSVDFVLSREEQWWCILGDPGAVSQLKNFHSAFSPDCPWVSEDIDGGYAIKTKTNKKKQ